MAERRVWLETKGLTGELLARSKWYLSVEALDMSIRRARARCEALLVPNDAQKLAFAEELALLRKIRVHHDAIIAQKLARS